MKNLFTLLGMMLLTLTINASIQRTVTFDFTNPESLTPSITPGASVGEYVQVTDKVFTNENVSISFDKLNGSTSLGAQILTQENYDGICYNLRISKAGVIKFSVPRGDVINSISFDGLSEMGDLYISNNVSGTFQYNSWQNTNNDNITTVAMANSGGSLAHLRIVTVTYTTRGDVLTPNYNIVEGSTLPLFKEITLSFDRKIKSVNNTNLFIKSSDESLSDRLNYSIDNNTVKLYLDTPIEIDGSYTINIPAGSIKDIVGFENIATTFTFKISTPKNIFNPTIDPQTGIVTKIDVIKLFFDKPISSDISGEFTLFKDNEEWDIMSLSKDAEDPCVALIKTKNSNNGYTDKGHYSITIPEQSIWNATKSIYNSEIVLSYDITGEEPYIEPESLQEAKEILELTGVGYPKVDSQERINLQALVSENNKASEEDLRNAIDAYYKCTNVQLPESDYYYNIVSVNKSGNSVYLHYTDEKVVLTDNSSEATAFHATKTDDDCVVFDINGNYLHVLTKETKYDLTSPSNITDTYNEQVNNLKLGKLYIEGCDAKTTFGLFSIYGCLGKAKKTSVTSYAYALIDHSSLNIETDAETNKLYFDDDFTNAFKLVLTEPEVEPIETDFECSVSTAEIKEEQDAVIFINFTQPVDLNSDKKVIVRKTDEKESISTTVQEIDKCTYSFNVHNASDGSYTVTIPCGMFMYTQNNDKFINKEIIKSFSIKISKFQTSFTDYACSLGSADYIKDSDFNNVLLYIVKDTTIIEKVYDVTTDTYVDQPRHIVGPYTNMIPNVTQKIEVASYYSDFVIASGHFEKVAIEEMKFYNVIKLILDKPIVEGSVKRQDELYSIIIPEATFGDANFGEYLKNKTIVDKTSCIVNPFTTITYRVYNEKVSGINNIETDRIQQTAIYDLSGRKVTNTSKPGIYIINGKKYVKK